jgi:hypothetical protein
MQRARTHTPVVGESKMPYVFGDLFAVLSSNVGVIPLSKIARPLS